MSYYTVKIYDSCAEKGPFAVRVFRHEFMNSIGAVVAGADRLATHADAEQLALYYRAQFGVSEAQS